MLMLSKSGVDRPKMWSGHVDFVANPSQPNRTTDIPEYRFRTRIPDSLKMAIPKNHQADEVMICMELACHNPNLREQPGIL